MSGPALDKATLIAIATTHPSLNTRRSAAHALYSFGCLQGTMNGAASVMAERAQELAAGATVEAAIAKASGAKP